MPETRAGQVASHLLSLHCCLGCAGGGREAAAQPGPWGHAPWAGVSAPAGSMCFQFLAYVSCLPVGTALSPSQMNLDSDSLRWEAEILFLFFFFRAILPEFSISEDALKRIFSVCSFHLAGVSTWESKAFRS